MGNHQGRKFSHILVKGLDRVFVLLVGIFLGGEVMFFYMLGKQHFPKKKLGS